MARSYDSGKRERNFLGECRNQEKVGIPKKERLEEHKAIIIFKRSERSYPGIVSTLKVVPEMNSLGDNVSGIKRSQKGNLMLDLKKSKDVNAGKFLIQIRTGSQHKHEERGSQSNLIELQKQQELWS